MANTQNKNYIFDTKVDLTVQKPGNFTTNDQFIAQFAWGTNSTPPQNLNIDNSLVVRGDVNTQKTKLGFFHKFMNCMEIDWGKAKWTGNINDDKNYLQGIINNGIESSDDLLAIIFWMWNKLNEADYPINWEVGNGTSITMGNATRNYNDGQLFGSLQQPTVIKTHTYTFGWISNGTRTWTGTDFGWYDNVSLNHDSINNPANINPYLNEVVLEGKTGGYTFYAGFVSNINNWNNTSVPSCQKQLSITWKNGFTGGPTGTITTTGTTTYTASGTWTPSISQLPAGPTTNVTYSATNIVPSTSNLSVSVITPPAGYTVDTPIKWYPSTNTTGDNYCTTGVGTGTHTLYNLLKGKTNNITLWPKFNEQSVTYYWYVGQTDPSTMTSISPIVSDNSSPGWREIGNTLPNYSSSNKLYDAIARQSDNSQIVTGSTFATQWVVIPAESSACVRDGFGNDGSNVNICTRKTDITIQGVTYKVYEWNQPAKKLGYDIY